MRRVAADKQKLACRFSRSMATYDGAAVVQREMAAELLERLLSVAGTDCFARVLELGCGTGLLTEQLVAMCRMRRLVLNDLVADCAQTVQRVQWQVAGAGAGVDVEFLQGDMETAAFSGLQDLVVSNAVLQWAGDLRGMLGRIAALLRAGGILAVASFGPSNLREVAELSGVSLRYESVEEWRVMLGQDYDVLDVGERTRTLWFSSAHDVLRHLKHTGVNSLDSRAWTSVEIRRFCRDYETRFALDQSVPLTYHPFFAIARKHAG